jgi:hypothetical protein
MTWAISAVDAPSSQVRIDPGEIPAEVGEGVEEMFSGLTSTQRGVVAFEDEGARDLARAQIRAYCEARKAGRLTASIWAGFTDAEATVFRQKATEGDKPALSLAFTVYVKKEKGSANGQGAA